MLIDKIRIFLSRRGEALRPKDSAPAFDEEMAQALLAVDDVMDKMEANTLEGTPYNLGMRDAVRTTRKAMESTEHPKG